MTILLGDLVEQLVCKIRKFTVREDAEDAYKRMYIVRSCHAKVKKHTRISMAKEQYCIREEVC